MDRLTFVRTLALASALASPLAGAATAITAVPPADYRASVIAPKSLSPLLLGPTAPARRIELAPPSAAEIAALKQRNATSGSKPTRRPLEIGIGRDVPVDSARIRLDTLAWVPAPDGGLAARIDVVSPGASGLRVGLRMHAVDPDLSLRVGGDNPAAEAFGPVPANVVAVATEDFGSYWTPVVEGPRTILELHLAPGGELRDSELAIVKVSHLLVAGPTLARLDEKAIGAAGPCEIDVACQPPTQALTDVANAVGRMVFSWESGQSYTCTGTLLNDSTTSFTPYFFTANHCLNDVTEPLSPINAAFAASTLNIVWFFRAEACGSKVALSNSVTQTGGAMVLGRSDDWDWALLRLNSPPPSGVRFSAWRAEAVPAGAAAIAVHHPKGDLAKWSSGNALGYQLYDDGSSFIQMRWNQGVTEGGSSGSGLFTFQGSGGYYELRGGLYGGDSSCSVPQGQDVYSRLDNALPLIKQYLTPNVPDSNGRVVAIEFYNASLKHFFITTSADEVNKLDTGYFKGWARTGLRFLAYAGPIAGANPVCRFYMRPEVGDSHFYSGDPTECAQTAERFGASWVYESADVFYIPLPNKATGTCPSNTRPVWRFFNTLTTNHRYTTEVAVRDELRGTPGWIAEGYGPDAVIMCSPN